MRTRFKGLDLIECLMNYGQRFVTLYRRQGSSRKFILDECSVLVYLFMILLDAVLSPGQLIIPALMLAIDLRFLFSSVQFSSVQSLSCV